MGKFIYYIFFINHKFTKRKISKRSVGESIEKDKFWYFRYTLAAILTACGYYFSPVS